MRVAIIDDHPLIQEAVNRLIQRESDLDCVGVCGDLESADNLLNQCEADVAICDLQFATGNSLGFVSKWTKSLATKLLISSAHDPAVFAPLCIGAGAAAYLHKSEETETLIEWIRDLGSGQLASSETNAASESAYPNLSDLTEREWEVLYEIGRGLSTKEIASQFYLSAKTIESHRANIKKKLGLLSKDRLASVAALICT